MPLKKHPEFYTEWHAGASPSFATAQAVAVMPVPRHFDAFLAAYEERYQSRYGFLRPNIPKVVHKFMDVHAHLHALVADGWFVRSGLFYVPGPSTHLTGSVLTEDCPAKSEGVTFG
jgi:hypothetical protein